MPEEQSPADKPFDATPHKLEEARKKGEIVRSADLNTAIVYGGFLLSAGLVAPWATQKIGVTGSVLWGQADQLAALLLAPGGTALAAGFLVSPAMALLAAIAFPAGLLVLSLIAQRAILFTPEKLMPKLNRLNPVSNAKQKYGANGLFQFAKATVKLTFISVLLALYLMARSEVLLTALYASPGQILSALGRFGFEFLAVATLLAVVIAAIDWMWEWHQHQQKNRMSRQEIMDETKTSEGDPQMKQQRRQRAHAIAMNQMLADVPKADVVIVNPTHYAVALTWDRMAGGVPVCVAKGVDEVARQIRETASEAGVPIFSDPPTARTLHAVVDIGAPILSDQFKAVAAAIRFADVMRAKAKKGGWR